MITLIKKELRENARWAILIFVVLGAGFAWAIDSEGIWILPLVGDHYQVVTMFGFPLAALSIGLLQVFQDFRSMRWSFLVHRPISRSRIFWAKLIAGLIIYTAVTSVPLWLTALWVSVPGHIDAPFDWRMMLPRVADQIAALPWYVAGILTIRRARWIGSRLLPLAVPFIASILILELSQNLGEAILLAAAPIVILLPAAWGAFISDGGYGRQPLATRLCTTACVAVGLALAVGFSFAMVDQACEFMGIGTGIIRTTVPASYAITKSGQIIQVSYDSQSVEHRTDIHGNPLPAPRPHESDRDILYAPSAYLTAEDARPFRGLYERLESPYIYLTRLGQYNGVNWYYDVTRLTIEGYNIFQHRYVGSIGPTGFVPPTEPAQAFPGPLLHMELRNDPAVVATSTTAYHLDLQYREASAFFSATPDEPILDAVASSMWNGVDDRLLSATVITAHAIHYFNEAGVQTIINLTHTYPPFDSVEVGDISNGRFIARYHDYRYTPGTTDWADFADSHGVITEQVPLPSLTPADPPEPFISRLFQALAIPPALLVYAILQNHRGNEELFFLILVGLGSLVATIAVMGRRRMPLAAKVAWIVTSLLLGVAGVLLPPCLYERVPLPRCPGCGRRRLASRERCEYCGAAFAPPANMGIEIFETLEITEPIAG